MRSRWIPSADFAGYQINGGMVLREKGVDAEPLSRVTQTLVAEVSSNVATHLAHICNSMRRTVVSAANV